MVRADAFVIDADNLARFHIPYIFGPYYIESAGFAAYDIAVAQPCNRKRTEPVLVTAGIKPVAGQYDESETALDHVQGIHDGIDTGLRIRFLLYEMGYYLAVGSGMEEAPLFFKILPQQ